MDTFFAAKDVQIFCTDCKTYIKKNNFGPRQLTIESLPIMKKGLHRFSKSDDENEYNCDHYQANVFISIKIYYSKWRYILAMVGIVGFSDLTHKRIVLTNIITPKHNF